MNRKEFLKTFFGAVPLAFLPQNAFIKSIGEGGSTQILDNPDVEYIYPTNENYDKLRQGFNKRIDRRPAIIALCKTTEGVVLAIKLAKKKQLSIAIRNGGHSFEGFSCNQKGLVIDLRQMKSIKWLDNQKIELDAGFTIGELYDVLLPKGRIIPTGSCSGVGIAGLTLGGGYGYFSRKFGLTCDSLLAVTMVDGNGKIIHSQNDNDLLWACKGGANGNFGVITSLTFKTHTAPKTFTSHRFKAKNLDLKTTTIILKKWFELTQNLPLTCFSNFVLHGNALLIKLINFGKEETFIDHFTHTLTPYCSTITQGTPKPIATAIKAYYGVQTPTYFKNASAGFYKNYTEIEPFVQQVLAEVLKNKDIIYQINTLGGAIQNKDFEENSCFPHRHLPYIAELQTYWEQTKKQEILLKKFLAIQKIIAANGITAQYANYPCSEFTNPLKSYYGKHLKRLMSLKKRYDPENRIEHEQSIKA